MRAGPLWSLTPIVLSIDGYMDTESEPLHIPATGDEQRVILKMPGGFEIPRTTPR
jgi:hypothetical protein